MIPLDYAVLGWENLISQAMGMLTRPYARLYGIENGITIDDCAMQTVWSTRLLRRLLRMPIDAGNACALRHSFFAPYDGVNQQVQRVRHSPISAPLGSPLLYVLAMNLRPALDVTFIEAHRRVRPAVTFACIASIRVTPPLRNSQQTLLAG